MTVMVVAIDSDITALVGNGDKVGSLSGIKGAVSKRYRIFIFRVFCFLLLDSAAESIIFQSKMRLMTITFRRALCSEDKNVFKDNMCIGIYCVPINTKMHFYLNKKYFLEYLEQRSSVVTSQLQAYNI